MKKSTLHQYCFSLTASCITCLISACSADRHSAEYGSWIAEIDTIGPVVTVNTLRGSVWDGKAKLIEELSIGQADGDEHYVFGQVIGFAANSEKIYIADIRMRIVRAFDHQGNYLHDIGSPGAGPGEYTYPNGISIHPTESVILIRDDRHKFLVFTSDGQFLQSWRATVGGPEPMVITEDGIVFTEQSIVLQRNPVVRKRAMVGFDLNGVATDTMWAPELEDVLQWVTVSGQRYGTFRFTPDSYWIMTPQRTIVSGVSTQYRLKAVRNDGSVMVIEKYWEPVALKPAEAAWYRRGLAARIRRINPDFSGTAPPEPAHKSIFQWLFTDNSNRIWVVRTGPGIHLPDGNEYPETTAQFLTYPCWRDSLILDVFDSGGRYLGEIQVPEDFAYLPIPVIQEGMMLAHSVDLDGVPRVKRYRLDIPE